MRKLADYLLFFLVAAIFVVLFGYPIFRVVSVAFTGLEVAGQNTSFTFDYFAAVLSDPILQKGMLNSAWLAVGTTSLSTIIALPLAVISARYDFPGKRLFGALLLVPLILPPFVGAIGVRQLLGRNGAFTAILHNLHLLNTDQPFDWLHFQIIGIMIVEALSLYPIIYLNISAALANIDPAMQLAAANLGATRWTIFRRITLPLLRPGLFAGATIVLVWSFTELGTPLMFDFNVVTPVQVFQKLGQVEANPVPYVLVVIMLVGSILLYVTGKLVLGRGSADTAVTKASLQSVPVKLGTFQTFLVVFSFSLICGLALLPHIAVMLMSFSGIGEWYQSALPRVFTAANYTNGLTHPLVVPSVQNSIGYASVSTMFDIVFGLMVAILVVRSRLPQAVRSIIDSLSMLPLAVPGLVMAFGYLAIALQLKAFFQDKHLVLLQSLFDVQNNPTLVLILAYAMRRLPYVVRSAVAGLQQTPVDLEMAARNLGASGFMTLRRITVPLIAANLIAGGLLALAFAMLEVSDSLILAQKESHWPITKAIYELYTRLGDGPYVASALGVWAMLILALTIVCANSLLGKKMGAMFRV